MLLGCFMGWTTFEGHERFLKVTKNVLVDQKKSQIYEVVWKDLLLGIRMIADMVNSGKESFRQSFHGEITLIRVCANMAPEICGQERNDNRKKIYSDISELFAQRPTIVKTEILVWPGNKASINALEHPTSSR